MTYNNWYNVIISADSILEELITYILQEKGSEGIEIKYEDDNIQIQSYHTDHASIKDLNLEIVDALKLGFPDEQYNFTIDINKHEPIDWVAKQADSFGIINIENQFLIYPPWKKDEINSSDDDILQLVIEPGSAFGTGEHPTTRQCLLAMKEVMSGGEKVLDLGAGSGILSIAAIMLKASIIEAIEIDENAYRNAKNNFEYNNLSMLSQWHTGTIHTFQSDQNYDLILANIFSKIILNDASKLQSFSKDNTKYIFSGILYEGKDYFLDEMSKRGFSSLKLFPEGEWLTVLMENSDK